VNKVSKNITTDVNNKLNDINEKIDVMETKIDVMETKIDVMETKIDVMETKIDVMETKINELDIELLKVKDIVDKKMLDISNESLSTLKLSHEAKNFMQSMTETSSSSEAIILILSKYYDTMTSMQEHINVTESRLNSLTISRTPIARASITHRGNTIVRSIINKKLEDN
jgi:chromosome segregation ATPase